MLIWLLTLHLTSAHAKGLLTKIGGCKAPANKDAANVMIVKQWHLSPRTVTKGFKEKYPHEKNQSAIYIALADKIKSKKIDMVIAEGCEGEINDEFTTAFNGWDLAALKKIAQTKGFDRIITNVPLKLEARFGDKIITMCGDNEKLIQEGNLRLSNLRGWAGFWTRLSEPKTADDDQTKLYTEAAAELLKESKDTPVEELMPKLKQRFSAELDLFNKSLTERNDSFIKTLQDHPVKSAAIVIGGLHAEDLKGKLEAAGFNCDLMEPKGYAREGEELIKEFQKALKE